MTTVPAKMTRAALHWPPMTNTEVPRAPTDEGMVLHWDGSARNLAGKTHDACVTYWRFCRRFHMVKRGWRDIGYSYGVCPHGGEFEGRTYGYEQAAQPGGNRSWVSCTLMLGPGEMPTDAQINGIRRLRARLMARGMDSEMRGHSQFISTDCPGPIIRALITNGTFTSTAVTSWTERAMAELPVLKLGDVSFDVKTVRGLLFARGYIARENLAEFLEITEFDSELVGKVRAFQTAKKLAVDGIVGPITWAKLLRVEVK